MKSVSMKKSFASFVAAVAVICGLSSVLTPAAQAAAPRPQPPMENRVNGPKAPVPPKNNNKKNVQKYRKPPVKNTRAPKKAPKAPKQQNRAPQRQNNNRPQQPAPFGAPAPRR